MSAHADIPEWEATVDAQGRVAYAHPRHAHAWNKQFAGTLVSVQVYAFREKRSGRQNRALHVLVSLWARERGWAVETLKQFVLGRTFGWLEFTDPQSGEVLKVLAEPHTSSLSMAQFCVLIETVLELAAEDGVWLQSPDEWRKAKDALAKKAARAERRVA